MTPIHQNFLDRKPSLEKEMGEELTISGIAGPYRIFQRLNGHRHSIDDTATAWYALQKNSSATKALDLGSGVGTVGLAVLWGLPHDAELTCIEAQDVSYKLLQANIACNDLGSRVTTIHGDIREITLDQKFSLITGSPPYFPIGTGVLPEDSQKQYARFELRGHVGDYARAAKRHLTDDGLFVFCFPSRQKSRGLQLVREVGFKIVSVRDLFPTKGREALFSLYAARLTWNQQMVEEPPFIVADEKGVYTEEMVALQKSRGFGPDGTNSIT